MSMHTLVFLQQIYAIGAPISTTEGTLHVFGRRLVMFESTHETISMGEATATKFTMTEVLVAAHIVATDTASLA